MTDEEATKLIRKVWERHDPMADDIRWMAGAVRKPVWVPPSLDGLANGTIPSDGGTRYVLFTAKEDGLHGKWRGVDVLVEPYA